ncbi:hypothetical protein [Streptomyces sp. NPDC093591]|uniref:hypothetical protein n=1 Tax=Streptomyces sp. NPDC093591 TaxID=3366044 RepID=UPI0038027778
MSQGQLTYHAVYDQPTPMIKSSVELSQGGSGAMRLHRDTTAVTALDLSGSDRAFHIVAHGHSGNGPLARVVTERPLSRLTGQSAVYRVEDPYGTPLGRITLRRRPLFWIGRTRWTLEPVVGPALRGFGGRMMWWVLWWPFGLPLSLLVAIWAFFSDWGDDERIRSPRRVTWRDGSGHAHIVFRGMMEGYQVFADGWDPRLIAALIGLHQSFDPNEAAKRGGWYAL